MKRFIILVLFLNQSFCKAQCTPDVATGLIARWDFNGNANDLSIWMIRGMNKYNKAVEMNGTVLIVQ